MQLGDRLAATEAAAQSSGILCLQGLPLAATARRTLTEARRHFSVLQSVVSRPKDTSRSAEHSLGPSFIQQLVASQLLTMHEEAAVAIEAAEAIVPAACDGQREHECAVVAGYDALGLAASRLAHMMGSNSGLVVDQTPVGQSAERVESAMLRSKAMLAAARQTLQDTTLTVAPSTAMVSDDAESRPVLEIMHKAVQEAISSVAAAGA